MDLERNVKQGNTEEALHRVGFVLDEIEKIESSVDVFFRSKIGKRLTFEEITGALVSAEQELKEVSND